MKKIILFICCVLAFIMAVNSVSAETFTASFPEGCIGCVESIKKADSVIGSMQLPAGTIELTIDTKVMPREQMGIVCGPVDFWYRGWDKTYPLTWQRFPGDIISRKGTPKSEGDPDGVCGIDHQQHLVHMVTLLKLDTPITLEVAMDPSVQYSGGGPQWQYAQQKEITLSYRLEGTTGGGVTGSSGITGTWDWFTGEKVYIHPDGTFEAWRGGQKSNSGTWTGTGNKYTLSWGTGGYIDSLTLSSDGKSLDGYNQGGTHVTATKSSSSDTVGGGTGGGTTRGGTTSGGTTSQPAKKGCTGSATSIYVEDRTMNPGQEVVIPIMMCNANDIANMDLSVSYDSKALQFKNAVKGSLNNNMLFESNNLGNKVKIAFAGKTGFSGSGSIAVLTFKVIGQSGASSPITVSVDSASTSNGNPVTVPVSNGKIQIGNSNPNDPGGRGKPTALDALIALQISVGKRPSDPNYDVTKDGTVNSNDAREILKLAVQ